jgi:hypothetical protein
LSNSARTLLGRRERKIVPTIMFFMEPSSNPKQKPSGASNYRKNQDQIFVAHDRITKPL